MSKLYFTIGLPRSGKSTVCDRWVKNYYLQIVNGELHSEQLGVAANPTRVIVCSDNIRFAAYGQRWWTPGEELVHAIQRIMITSLLNRSHDVIVDGTHTTKRSIRRLLEIDSNAQYVFIDTDVETCLKRAKDNGQKDLYHIIEKMNQRLLSYQSSTPHPSPRAYCRLNPNTMEIEGCDNSITMEYAIQWLVESIRQDVKNTVEYVI